MNNRFKFSFEYFDYFSDVIKYILVKCTEYINFSRVKFYRVCANCYLYTSRAKISFLIHSFYENKSEVKS